MKMFRTLTAAVLACMLYAPIVQADDEIVWFVHGMITMSDDGFKRELDVLKQTYPLADEVVLKKWNSPIIKIDMPDQIREKWNAAVNNSEAYATYLAQEIQDLTWEKRDRLILVGHSLGARIVVRASAILQKDRIRIRKIVLSGAAIDNNDPDIPATYAVSKSTVENIVNPNDFLMGVYHSIGQGNPPLGTGYLYVVDPAQFREILMSNTMVHFGYVYLSVYRNVLKSGNYVNEQVIVPQSYVNAKFSTGNQKFLWKTLDSCHDWELQQNNFTGHSRILDNNSECRAWGDLTKMKLSFDRVKQQLNENKSCRNLPGKWWESVNLKQNYWNWESQVADGDVWWDTLDCYKGWKMEKHRGTGHCRIIDPGSNRRAWGGENKMRDSFDDVKPQIDDLFDKHLDSPDQ